MKVSARDSMRWRLVCVGWRGSGAGAGRPQNDASTAEHSINQANCVGGEHHVYDSAKKAKSFGKL
jgi:hypothetical protein